MRTIWMLFTAVLLSALFTGPARAAEGEVFTALLSEHVGQEGLVDYPALCEDPRLDKYLNSLARSDPSALKSRDAKISFWLNAYNAYMLKAVCNEYPVKSVNDLHAGGLLGKAFGKTVWDKPLAVVNGRKMTLNAIEHDILRAKFNEPRIHFALVCAALSCPPLRREAYVGERLDEQLDEQGRRFINDPKENTFDVDAKAAAISAIFKWFAEDFGGRKEALRTIARYLPDQKRRVILEDPDSWRIRYQHYAWTLNDQVRIKQ